MARLVLSGVAKAYGDVRAVAGLDLEVSDGELIALVGPSGCGKSTALRIAAGLERPDAGHVFIGGRDVTTTPPASRNVAMVFQNYALFPHLSVADNIGIGLAVRKVPKSQRLARVRAAAEAVGCAEKLERKPGQLSGGERQRVALARALVRAPDVFLLDEPLSNLDAQLRVQMRAELQRLQQRLGATMVYVTHDQVEALTLGHRVAVLGDGVLHQVATPEEIYRRPANRFVATFIGSPAMNLLPVHRTSSGLIAGPFAFGRLAPPSVNGTTLELGIRPEHLRVNGSGGVPAVVEVIEAAGNETYLHLSTGKHRLVARVPGHIRPRLGARVTVDVPAHQAYLFDARTGRTVHDPPRPGPPR